MIRRPPSRLEASFIDSTVTSILAPGLTFGSRLPVTMTAATFLGFSSAGSTVTSSFSSMLAIELMVIWLLVPSPVPFRPTTRP